MKIKLLSISDITPNTQGANPDFLRGLNKLIESTTKHGYDHELIIAPFEFGGQMKHLWEWCKDNKNEYTHFCYTDAFDTIALAPYSEFEDMLKSFEYPYYCFIGSAEKGCYPNPDLASKYPMAILNWKYVNAGQFFCSIDWFLEMCEKRSPIGINDQTWLSETYLRELNKYNGTLDVICRIFQSIAFEDADDFAVTRDGRLLNRKTGSIPIMAHGNGKTSMEWIYDFAK